MAFLPCLSQILDGWKKNNPPRRKKLPVEADVPKLLVKWGLMSAATVLAGGVGDLTLKAFYFLL